MTDKQFRDLCHGIQEIGSGVDWVIRTAKDLSPEDKYDAIMLTNVAGIIVSTNNLLHEFLSEVKITG